MVKIYEVRDGATGDRKFFETKSEAYLTRFDTYHHNGRVYEHCINVSKKEDLCRLLNNPEKFLGQASAMSIPDKWG